MRQARHGRNGLRALAVALVVVAGSVMTACAPGGSDASQTPKPSVSANGHQRALEKFAACMRERGWDSHVTGDSVTTDSTSEQQTALNADGEACSKGTLPDISKMTDAEWQKAYDLQLKTAACLEKLGFTVPPPSLQVFQQQKGQWNPYVDLVSSGAMAGPDVNKYELQCPQSEYFPGD